MTPLVSPMWFLCLGVLLASFVYRAEGEKECTTTRPNCAGLSLEVTGLLTDITCTQHGNRPHPIVDSMYIFCKGSGYKPCECVCLDDRVFSYSTRHCVKAEPEPNAAAGNEDLYVNTNTATVYDAAKTTSGLKKIIKADGIDTNLLENEVIKHVHNASIDGEREVMRQRPTSRSVISATKIAAVARVSVVEDDSIFPAWGIAVLVLTVVVLGMLVILILY